MQAARFVIVVSNPKEWPHEIPEVPVISASSYLTDASFSALRGLKVFNLCGSYRYQSAGYYVSLLAVARGHRAFPDLPSILDMKSPAAVRDVSDDLDEKIQRSLGGLEGEEFVLYLYFGESPIGDYAKLGRELYNLFQAPLLRARFQKHKQRWELKRIRAISAEEAPEQHKAFLLQQATLHFARGRLPEQRPKPPRYSLAILWDPGEQLPPSDDAALRRFAKVAQAEGFWVERLRKEDFSRLAEFDALFIRETTAVNHHTWRFARKAAAEGMAVIDDPDSILRCTNKVYLAELLSRRGIPTPRTLIVHKGNADTIFALIGVPCVLKYPDSSFSRGVVKVANRGELDQALAAIFKETDLLVAQEYVPTEFDWRVGVFDRQPLYACRYLMARGHWQIVKTTGGGQHRYGRVECLPVEQVPAEVIQTAVKAAGLIGDGLYGVDLKEYQGKVLVMEINDNPNIDRGSEDEVLGDELYRRLVQGFLRRIERPGKEG